MKKYLSFVLSGVLALSLAGCSSGTPAESPKDSPDQKPSDVIQSEQVPPASEPVHEEELESSGELGDYSVQINGFELAEDYAGNPAILVSYTFTNNGEDAANAMTSVTQRAYQNGVQLDSAIITDSSIFNSSDSMKDIKTGASIDLKVAFVLTSETAPVEFEISEWISFSDDKLGKTFEIAEGGATVLAEAPAGTVSKELGDYIVSVVDYKLSEDYEGKPVIIINLGFTNNGETATNFMGEISCDAFQDGIELESAIVVGDDSGNGESQMRYVKPGAGIPVSVAFVLTSDTSPVELEISEFISFSNDKLETSIDLQ